MTRFFILIHVLFFSLNAKAQDKSNRGREFWLGYGHNVLFTQSNPVNDQTLALYISAEQAAVVTVSVNGTAFSQTVNIPANSVDYSIAIPKTGASDARIFTEGLSARGVHIVSDVPVVVYAHQYGLFSSGATMLMPVETYGYTYYSLNFEQNSNYPDSYSWFYVVAPEDNTRLQITPSDSTQGGLLPGQVLTVNLNKGEIYNVFGKKTGAYTGKDMTGSKVVSVAGADGLCHPVAMFSGASRMVICNAGGGEFVQQQIFPANAWGTQYVTYPNMNNISGNLSAPSLCFYRVAVRNPTTVVKRNGVVLTGLINNFYYEFSSRSGDNIEADGPVLVAQYTLSANECTGTATGPEGDPDMVYLSPIEQGVKKAIFYNTRNQFIDYNFANVIVPVNGLSSLLFDGNPVMPAEYIIHPANNKYAVVVKRLTGAAAQHSITCDSTFIAVNYGLGITESYAYNVGTLVNNLNAISSIANTLNTNSRPDSFTCPKSPVKLFIKVAYRATSINWRLSQAGGGISPNTDSLITNPIPVDSNLVNGRKYYTYSLQQDFRFIDTGTFYVPVVYASPDIDNCNRTETSSVRVRVLKGPLPDFSISNANCFGDTVLFTGTSVAGNFILAKYNWLFSNNTTANTVNAKKRFATAGAHAVKYSINADNGCVADTVKTILIAEKPLAKFGFDRNVCVGDSIRFTDSSTTAAGAIASWKWSFGNGNKAVYANGNPFYHPYTAAGSYTISLTVSTATGCQSDTAYKTVVVFPSAVTPGIAFTGDTLCPNANLLFTSIISPADSIKNWQWSYGEGTTATMDPVSKSYSQPGTYNVVLVVKNNHDCASLPVSKSVVINTIPVADAGPSFTVFPGTIVQFSPSVNDSLLYQFRWTPALGLSNANILRPSLLVQQNQTYTLNATGPGNCTASDTMQVKLLSALKIINAFSPNGDGINDTWILPGLEDYPSATVQIFDRYGRVVYSSTGSPKPWDGKLNGNPLPVGTYYYIIDSKTDFVKPFSGAVTILK